MSGPYSPSTLRSPDAQAIHVESDSFQHHVAFLSHHIHRLLSDRNQQDYHCLRIKVPLVLAL